MSGMKLGLTWWKDSRSMTRQETPSGSSAMMLAVRFSSLKLQGCQTFKLDVLKVAKAKLPNVTFKLHAF
jgi:hypothetical protein